ncbi:MAG: hypothetical protein KUG77_14520 [Nannocystaceae bacterium]|nr:hypothetical protein [Nannocystaceae bacterium]
MRQPWPQDVPRLTYGITPPKLSFDAQRRKTLAEQQTSRVGALPIDALVVYDLQDESSRTDAARPFPYLQTVDPLDYATQDLAGLEMNKVVYRSVAKQGESELVSWMQRAQAHRVATVFVGAPSAEATIRLRLSDAYRLRQANYPELLLGGIAIAERHRARGEEDARIAFKQHAGCSFFVSQAVYDVTATKDLLSDLWFRSVRDHKPMPAVLVTLSPCGSLKTLEFLDWLGVVVPRWVQNELREAGDILRTSVDTALAAFEELHAFAESKGFRLGCNVESVALRKAEIDASVEMVHRVAGLMGRG